jgi:predicted AAA+ superfamily ATPase
MFGRRPIHPRTLCGCLVHDVIDQFQKKGRWTRSVKHALLKLGKRKKRYCAPNQRKDQPEFLFDFLWFRNCEMNDILLAVESEKGSRRQVLDDFGRLLLVKAPLKLLVFSTTRRAHRSHQILDGIQENYMQKFSQHVEGEEYVLLEFVEQDQKAYCHYYKIPKNGNLRRVKFEQKWVISYPEA